MTSLSSEDAERLRAYERQGHNALADSYHDFFTPVTMLAIEPLLQAARVRAGSRLLDVATGPGAVAAEAARRGALCVGVDLAPKMIELARRLHPGIEFCEGDVERLPFDDHAFDAVVCNFGLGHFPRPEDSVRECMRVLRPGGRLALSWWDDPARQRVQGLFREALTELGIGPPPDVPRGHNMMRFSDTAAFLTMLRDTGLADAAVSEHTATSTFPDTETVWRGGLGSFVLTGAAIRHQDEATQRALRAAFERHANDYKTPSGLALPVAFKIGSGRRPP